MKKSTLRKYIRQVIEEQMGMQRQTPRPTMTPNRAGGRQTPRPGGGRQVKISADEKGIKMITNLIGNPRTNGEWLEAYKKWYVQNQDNVVSGNLGSPQEVEACFRDKGIPLDGDARDPKALGFVAGLVIGGVIGCVVGAGIVLIIG
jgi:hypothetical protein